MLFEKTNSRSFNIPNNLFISNSIYTSYSKIGNFIKNGYIGPDGADAISHSKALSVKKAFSEMSERRALMIGGKSIGGNVKTWDLIKQDVSEIPYDLATYSTKKPYPIDTTGTASHINGNTSIFLALKELIEKNALFLFWYGQQGFRIEIDKQIEKNLYYKMLINNGWYVDIYLNLYFLPVMVVIVIVHNNTYIISSGIGSNFNYFEAINKALEEAFLMKWHNESLFLVDDVLKKNSRLIDLQEQAITLEYSHYIRSNLQKYNIDYSKNTNENDLSILLSNLPEWISNLHVIYLPNNLNRFLKIVKVFSYDLYNHVPLKKYIDLDRKINQETIKFTTNEINEIPDCIII